MSVQSQAGRQLERVIGSRAKRRVVRALDPWVAALYRGDAVECPCCGRTFRAFRNFQGNAQCPYCGVLERHRLLWLYLTRDTNLLATGTEVLHMAPERGVERALKHQPGLRHVSADLSPERADVVADLTGLPFADESFDWALCSHVLEHVPDDVAAMSELCRVLRRGGTAIVMYPVEYGRAKTYEDSRITSPEERERAFGQHDHVRIYGADHIDRLVSAGFDVHVEKCGARLDQRRAERYGLVAPQGRNTTDEIYVCRRPE
jgi:SAM-dependent methyltransferase